MVLRLGLATTHLRGGAYASWHIQKRVECDIWTYESFRTSMIEQYHPEGHQTTREETFFTTTYDPIILVPEVIRRF